MAESLGIDGEVRELRLGSSFEKSAPVSYHSIRYDFKPASVDKSQMATVDIGESNSVTVTVPHIEGAGVTNTIYKGNKRPSQKECILVIDHQTGEITLEKLTSNIHLKKTRQENVTISQRPHPVTEKIKDLKCSPSKKKPHPAPESNEQLQAPRSDGKKKDIDLMSSSASSNTESDDDDDDERTNKQSGSTSSVPPVSSVGSKDYHSLLSVDLQLSESGSDSD